MRNLTSYNLEAAVTRQETPQVGGPLLTILVGMDEKERHEERFILPCDVTSRLKMVIASTTRCSTGKWGL